MNSTSSVAINLQKNFPALDSSYKMMQGFIFILIIGIFVLFFFILFRKKKSIFFLKKNLISEITRFYYSPKVYLSITKIGNKYFLLGVSDFGINNLIEIKDKELLNNLEKKKNDVDFSSFLTKYSKIFKKDEKKDGES